MLALAGELLPVGTHRLQQLKGAAHIALGRQVHHQVGIGLLHRRCRGFGVGEVHLEELVACLRLGQRLNIPGLSPPELYRQVLQVAGV